MLLIYTGVVVALSAVLCLAAGVVAAIPGIGTLTRLAPVQQLVIWYLLFVSGYLLLKGVVLLAWRLEGINLRESMNRLRSIDRKLRLPGNVWILVAVLLTLAAGMALVALTQGIATPAFYVSSVVFVAYLEQARVSQSSSQRVGAVQGLHAEPPGAAGEVNLRWEAPSDVAFAGVDVRRTVGVPAASVEDGFSVYKGYRQTYRDRALEPGTDWFYTVFSLAPDGRPGEPAIVRAGPPGLPWDPIIERVEANEHEIELTWERPAIPNLAEFRVLRRADRLPETVSDGEQIYRGNRTVCRDVNLRPAAQYFYRVFSVDRFGQTSPGTTREVATRAPSVTDARIWIERGQVHLTWRNPLEPIPEIVVVRKIGTDPVAEFDGEQFLPGRVSSWTDPAIQFATTYHYAIFTRYPNNIYGLAQIVRITTPEPPPPIQDFEAGQVSRTTVRLQWRLPEAVGFGGVRIRRTVDRAAINPDDGDRVWEGPEREEFVDRGLRPGTEYVYTAFSYSDAAQRYYSVADPVARVTTLPAPQPVVFHPHRLDPVRRQIILSWTRQDPSALFVHLRRWHGEPPASDNYEEPGGNLLSQYEEIRYVDRDLLPGQTYHYIAYAVDAEGCASVGIRQTVTTPRSWLLSVVLIDQPRGRRVPASLPEDRRLDQVLPEVLRRLGLRSVTNLRVYNNSQNFEYRLDGTFSDHGTEPNDEIILNYEQGQEAADVGN